MFRTTVATLLVAVPGLAHAADHATGPGARSGLLDIPVAEWIELAAGRTLTYTVDGEFLASERYADGGNRVGLQFFDGTCLIGTWEYLEPLYCFHWDGEGTDCFRHTRLGDEILILETDRGVETGSVQVMSATSDVPLDCGPVGTS